MSLNRMEWRYLRSDKSKMADDDHIVVLLSEIILLISKSNLHADLCSPIHLTCSNHSLNQRAHMDKQTSDKVTNRHHRK